MGKAYITKHSVDSRKVARMTSGQILSVLPAHEGNSIDLDFGAGEVHTSDLTSGIYEITVAGDNGRIRVGAGAVANKLNGKFWMSGRTDSIFVRDGERISVISDSIAAPASVTISSAVSKNEGNSGANLYTYTVTRSVTAGAVSVPWSFTAGATSADDFTGGIYPVGGNVNLADGVASGTFSVSVNGDTVLEDNETFTVMISTPAGYVAGAATSATGTILNDDTAPTPPPSLAALIKPYAAPLDPAAVMSSPPTITTSGTAPNGTTYPLQLPSASVPTFADQDPIFKSWGAFPILNASGYQRLVGTVADPSAYVSATDVNAAGWLSGASSVGIVTNAPKVVFQCNKVSGAVQNFRVRINGVYAAISPVAQAAGSNTCYVEIDFGSGASRYVELESEGTWGVRRIYVPAGYTVAAPTIPTIRMMLVGDSFIQGPSPSNYSGGVQMDGMGWQMLSLMGGPRVVDMRLAGLGGTSYTVQNPTGRLNAYSDDARVSDALNCAPDNSPRSAWAPQQVAYWGGVNCLTNGGGTAKTPAQIAAGAVAVVTKIRAHPSARGVNLPLFFFGIIPRKADASVTGKTFADCQAAETAMFAALNALNDKYVATIPVATAATPWIGPANWDALIGADGTHLGSISSNRALAVLAADGLSVAAAAMANRI